MVSACSGWWFRCGVSVLVGGFRYGICLRFDGFLYGGCSVFLDLGMGLAPFFLGLFLFLLMQTVFLDLSTILRQINPTELFFEKIFSLLV